LKLVPNITRNPHLILRSCEDEDQDHLVPFMDTQYKVQIKCMRI
jgi:hypothetical protein